MEKFMKIIIIFKFFNGSNILTKNKIYLHIFLNCWFIWFELVGLFLFAS